MKRICVVLTTRGNFAKMKTAMRAIVAHPELELQLVVGGALLNRQAEIAREIERQGFTVTETLDYMVGQETPGAITQSAARCLQSAGGMLERLRPDVLMVIADRYEALALAQAALCSNVRIAHLEGGEVSGSIDERIRHAISKLAHFHLAASQSAAERLLRLGEKPDSIVVVGSPSFDLLRDAGNDGYRQLQKRLAGEPAIDLEKPFLLVSHHPVVTEYDKAGQQYCVLAESVLQIGLPVIWIWPNNDAGAGSVGGVLDWLRAQPKCPPLAVVPALPMEEYGAALSRAACLVGNSSSAIREAAFLGAPAVNIGTRQQSRERGTNVVDVPCEGPAIVAGVRKQMTRGKCTPDLRYGDGSSGTKIAAFLAGYWPPLDKTITY
jgi:UDP-hydrolysing UDP-N-acetyl-D-glucosamine 2-epimerase